MYTLVLSQIDWHTSWWEAGLRMMLAVGCAGLIGWDREAEGRAAGLRTHMMVALGAAGFTLFGLELMESVDLSGTSQSLDAARVFGAIVGGIGFLGAGAIIQSGGNIRGLTTAAGLWTVAAIGMTAAGGYYAAALMLTGLSFLILVVLRTFEQSMFKKKSTDE